MKAIKLAKSITTPNMVYNPTEQVICKAIECNGVEYVKMPKISDEMGFPVIMCVDAHGKQNDDNLFNVFGTGILWTEYGVTDFILGKVVLLKERHDDEGKLCPVPFEDLEAKKLKEFLNSKEFKLLKKNIASVLKLHNMKAF